jgi:hypothetical protein
MVEQSHNTTDKGALQRPDKVSFCNNPMSTVAGTLAILPPSLGFGWTGNRAFKGEL